MTPLLANRWLIALPPIWLLGMGAIVAIAVILLAWGALLLLSPRAAAEAKLSLRDGFAGPMAWLLLTLSALAVALTPLVPLDAIGRSLARLLAAQGAQQSIDIAPRAVLQEIPIDLRPQELESFELQSDAPLTVRTQQPIEGFAVVKVPDVELSAMEAK